MAAILKTIAGFLAALAFVSLGACTYVPPSAPEFVPLEAPPTPMTIEKITTDYFADEPSADLAYAGKKLYFEHVTVQKLNRFGAPLSPEAYIVIGDVMFKPRYTSEILLTVAEGTIIDIEGKCQGPLWGYIIIDDCWVKAVGGATASGSGY